MLRLVLACGVLATLGVTSGSADQPTDRANAPRPRLDLVDATHLLHVRRWNSRVLTGGTPAGPMAFDELAALGVRTVVSVDGAVPDVAGARAVGIRYVHLPLGYGAVPSERAGAFAKAVRDLPAPVYFHCHHGRHRAPVAAAIGCVGAGVLEPAEVEGCLQAAGTNPGYRGLYRSAILARRLSDETIDDHKAPLPESAEVRPLAAAMAEIDVYHGRLVAAQEAGWPVGGSDSLAEDALMLRELATELLRSLPKEQRPAGFSPLLRTLEQEAEHVRAGLVVGDSPEAALRNLSAACVSCHDRHRDGGF
ncbi:MAG: hypothetical protein AAGA92_12655 [Planctomycetota bacterium]